MVELEQFEKTIGYKFNNIELLKQALTHSSYSNEHADSPSYERLEFLGDSVLGLIVAGDLFDLYPDNNEGVLSKMKSHIVKEETLCKYAAQIELDKYIYLGRSEQQSEGNRKSSIVSDCFESVLGAIYKDGGFNAAVKWLGGIIDKSDYLDAINHLSDYKTTFQEHIQKNGSAKIEYRQISETGPAHNKTFTVAVYVNGKFFAKGSAGSKKQAEQNAAKKALNMR